MTAHRDAGKVETPDGFRPDLEGLRAVAVVLVLLYHAHIPGFGGGYIGVDVFFVLSGFLITGLLLRELGRSGTVSLPNFYARRARRLLPAALLVLLATVIGSAIVLPPLRVPHVGGDVAAASLYVSNIRFALQATDYLKAELAPSPVLHYWSLGVEEQFYIFWPAIVLLVGRRTPAFARRVGISALNISVVSLTLAFWLTMANGPWAFFSLTTRAWELGIGAVLAVAGVRVAVLSPHGMAAVGWLGLTMVALAGIVLSVDTPFPGTAALLPTLGSALVIVAGTRPSGGAPGRFLGMSAPRYIGRISYSLYLWHWPVLILTEAGLGHPLRIRQRVVLVLVAVGLAALTQRFVEDPLRHGRLVGTLPRLNLILAGAFSLIVALVAAGTGAAATARLAASATVESASATAAAAAAADQAELDRILGGGTATSPDVAPGTTPGTSPRPATADGPVPAGLRPSLAQAHNLLPSPYNDGCHLQVLDVRSPDCLYGQASGSTAIMLFGDSHALSWWPAVERVAIDRGWRFVSLTKSACPSTDVLQWKRELKRIYTECEEWRISSLARIAAERPAFVILANSQTHLIINPDGTPMTGRALVAEAEAGLARTIARINAMDGPRAVVLADTPRSNYDVPECLSQHRYSLLACATPFKTAVSAEWVEAVAAAARAGGATFIDPAPWVCPSEPCPPVIGNFMVLRDQHHLALPFAAALAGRLGAALPEVPNP